MATVNRRASQGARPLARPASRPAARTGSSGYRGAEGMQRMEQEQIASEARREAQQTMSGMPFRFFVPPGETRDIVIVDDAPDFFRHEHNLKDGHGKWKIFTPCINEHANCPVCASSPEKSAYFAMYLTIIDLTPYINNDNIEVPWSKKLLVVKPSQQKKIMRLLEAQGSLRGMVLSMTRDGEKDAAIGNDIQFLGEVMDEDQLAQYVNEYENKDRKVITVVGSEVFDYDELFPEMTEEMLEALLGTGGSTTTRNSHDRAIGRSAAPAARGRSSGDDWQNRAPPARRAAAPAAPARRARTIDPEDVPDAGQEEEQEAPQRAARPAARPAPTAARPAARPAPRARLQEPDPEQEEEEAPQRAAPVRRGVAPVQAPSMADKRRALRGR